MATLKDILDEQERQKQLLAMMAMGGDERALGNYPPPPAQQPSQGNYSDMFNPSIPLPPARQYTGNTLADIARNPNPNWSQETKDALARRADLSGTLRVSHNGNDVSNLFDSGGGGQIRNERTGAVTNLGQSQPAGPAMDYSMPIEIGGYGKGYRLKGDATRAVLANGQIVSMGRDTGAERARMKEDLAMDKVRAEIAQLNAKPLNESTYDKKMSEFKAQYDAENKFYGGSGAQREANAINQKMLERRFGNAPAGSRWDEKGNAIQIPVFDAAGNPVNSKDSKATEDEKKTAYHASKMLDSINRIGQLSKESTDAMTPGIGEAMAASTAGAYSGTANVARSGNRQAVFGLQADLVDSLLYLATGAAYNKEQLEQKRESLLPAFTDKPEAIEEKKRSLQQYMTAAKIRAGNAWKPEMESALKSIYADSAAAKETKAPPANGTVKGGYVFIGGDPAKESSWKKVQ